MVVKLGEKGFILKLGWAPLVWVACDCSFRGLESAVCHEACEGDQCSSLLEQPGSGLSSAGGGGGGDVTENAWTNKPNLTLD